MQILLHQRVTSSPLAPRLGRIVASAILGLVGLIAPAGHGQTNTNGCFAAPAGLVGWWRAEGDAADFTGANSGSFPFGSAFAPGVVGQAFDFDGSSRRVSIPDSPALQLTNGMTLEAWVYPRAYGGFITFRGDNRGGLDTWVLDTYETGYVKFQIDDEANNYQAVRAPLALNQWQHVAATWDQTSGTMKIYVNGLLAQQTNTPVIPIGALDPGSEPAIGIGNHGGTFHQFPFNGLIDELGIYNRALSSNEVANIFLAGSAGKCTGTNPPVNDCVTVPAGVISWWRGESGALDSVQTHNGTPVGGVTIVPGKVGNGFGFDGTGYVVVPHHPSLNCSNALTIELWYKSTQSNDVYYGIIDKRVGAAGANYGINVAAGAGLGIYYDDLAVQDGDDTVSSFEASRSAPAPGPGVFHHLAATYRQTSNNLVRLETYVDGQNIRTRYIAGNLASTVNTAPVTIGATAQGAGEFFKGVIDEITIYNRALSAAEIQTIYAANDAGKCAGTNPPPPSLLVSVDFGAGLNGSDKTGFAALGQTTNDFWNYYTRDDGAGGWRTFGVLANLKTVGGTDTAAGLTVANAPGAWGNGSPDAMYDDYIYPFNGGTVTVTITNLPTGQYDVLAYAYDGNFALTSGGVSYGVQTTHDPIPTNPPAWTVGVQYARFVNVNVGAGQPLELTVRPGLDGYAVISGLQICASANSESNHCVTPPAGIVSWWRAEGNGVDSITANHGTLTGDAHYTPGRIGQGFVFDGDRDGINAGTAANLQLQDFTVEAWIKRSSEAVISFNGNGNGQLFTVGAGGGGYTFYLQADSRLALGKLQVNVVTSDAVVTDTNWHHVAVTKAGTTVTFFVDGVAYAAPAYDSGGFTFNGPAYVGAWLNPSQLVDNTFYGAIDEMAVYNRALAPVEIQSIYGADVTGKCAPATLAPAITQHPQDTVVIAGGVAQFDVVATGVPAPDYQWYFNGNPLPGRTSASLILTNVMPAQDGTYSVRVSNSISSILSSNATLSVVTTQAVVLVDGNTSGFYNEALGTILDGTAPQFPIPFDQGGGDPTFFPADEPNLAAGAGILGNWLTTPPGLNSNWHAVAVIPTTWALNTETAIIYPVDGGPFGIANLRGDFDADNGIYVWVNGQFKFGARAPGLPSPIGQYEYTNVVLGSLVPGSNYIQILREDSGISVGYQIRLTGTTLSTNRQPPIIVQSPTNQSVAAGGTALFSVVADGTPELSYQWRYEGGNLAGATNSSLVLPGVLPPNAGGYSVLVSNAYGAVTSSIATLTVLTYPPVITRQPTNLTVIETTAASFSVQATGSMTLTYQWLFNGSPLAGKTATALSFASVQLSNAGNYSVIVTNPYGVVTSSVATLTVNPIPPCTPAPDGLVSWWKGENSLIDNWDSNNAGTFSSYQAGKVGQAFFNPFLTVADSPSLRLTNGLTIEAWVNPSSITGTRVILAKYEYPPGQPFGTQSAYLLGTTNNGALFFLLTPNGSVRTNATLVTTNTLPVNQWSHVAATYDGNIMRLHLNGTPVAQTNYAGRIFPGTAPLGIGGFPPGTSSPWQFSGWLDEVSIYNRALSTSEIQAIAAAAFTGKCLVPPLITQQPQSQAVPLGEDVKLTATVLGNRPLTYQWYLNGPATQFTTQRITGATNAFLVIERIKTNNTGTYTLRVTNSAGFDLSAAAQINLLPAPSCTEMLPDLISWWPGNSNTLDVTGLNNIGTYSPASYPTGKVASGFTFNGSNSRITINNSTSLNFGSNANFSIEMWIRATNSPPAPGGSSPYPNVPLFEKRTTPTTGWVGYSLSLNQGRLAFAMGTPGTSAPGAVSNYISSGPDLRDAMFHHVAVTVNRAATNGGVLYVDGVPVLTFNPKPLNVSLVHTSPLYLGAPTVTLSNSYFAGLIDEPAIYSRDLTAAEILSIRTAGAAGRCKAPPLIVTQPGGGFVAPGSNFTLTVVATGTPALRYQWRRNVVPLTGATNATLNLINLTAANAGTYSVIVSNAFGSALSSNAVVVINRLPTANPDAFTTPSNTAAVFPVAKLLLNDSDADGDSLTVIAVSTNSGHSGTVSLVSGTVTYTPPGAFVGNDTFTYLLADKPGGTTVGTVMVTVGAGGAAPMNIVFGPVIDHGQFVVRFAGIPGLTYTIEAASSLDGTWSKVANLTAPTTDTGLGIGVFEFRETATGEVSRYYRTVYPSY